MIFKQIDKILSGAKTQTRRVVKPVHRAALKAARPTATPQVLYEGEAAVLKHGILLSTLGARIAMRGHKRVHIIVTALEDDES